MTAAACATTDPEIFFPAPGGRARAAKQVCQRCGIRAQCLAWALTRNEQYGIWGGLTERERRRVRRAASLQTVKAAV